MADWPSIHSHRSDPDSNPGSNQGPQLRASLSTTEPPAYNPHGRGQVPKKKKKRYKGAFKQLRCHGPQSQKEVKDPLQDLKDGHTQHGKERTRPPAKRKGDC